MRERRSNAPENAWMGDLDPKFAVTGRRLATPWPELALQLWSEFAADSL
jgi:hypothetical protein